MGKLTENCLGVVLIQNIESFLGVKISVKLFDFAGPPIIVRDHAYVLEKKVGRANVMKIMVPMDPVLKNWTLFTGEALHLGTLMYLPDPLALSTAGMNLMGMEYHQIGRYNYLLRQALGAEELHDRLMRVPKTTLTIPELQDEDNNS
jgi:hypothetical protein